MHWEESAFWEFALFVVVAYAVAWRLVPWMLDRLTASMAPFAPCEAIACDADLPQVLSQVGAHFGTPSRQVPWDGIDRLNVGPASKGGL